jgi:multiple sugar transport system substrate-binding protein
MVQLGALTRSCFARREGLRHYETFEEGLHIHLRRVFGIRKGGSQKTCALFPGPCRYRPSQFKLLIYARSLRFFGITGLPELPRLDRRDFLRYGLGVAGAGLFSLGLADLVSPKLLGQNGGTTPSTSTSLTSSATSATSSSSSGLSSSTQFSSLPDYQDFLSWLQSVSGPYAGKTLNVTLEAEFGPYATQFIDSDFAKATGIRDGYNIAPYALQLQTVSLMASTKSSAYDAYSLDVENLGVFPSLPISPYELAQRYPTLTYPNIDFEDFHRYSWDRIATYPPDLSGGNGGNSASNVTVLPFDTPTMILFYRKDVFQKLGLTPPATWDEHFSNCKAIQKSGLTPFGSVSMAAPDISVIYEYQAHLASFGGSLWEIEGNTIIPTMNTDAGLAALEDFIRFEPYSDPGSETYTWDNVFESLAHESAAQGLLWDGFSTWMEDKQRSYVLGLMGYAQNPAGPSGSFHPYAGSGVGVSSYSKNPEMAWLWIQWATAKGTQEAKLLGNYHNYPTRSSVTTSPQVADAFQTSGFGMVRLVDDIWAKNSLTTLLGFPLWLQAATILELALNAAWIGSFTPSQALTQAQTKIEAMGKLSF